MFPLHNHVVLLDLIEYCRALIWTIHYVTERAEQTYKMKRQMSFNSTLTSQLSTEQTKAIQSVFICVSSLSSKL